MGEIKRYGAYVASDYLMYSKTIARNTSAPDTTVPTFYDVNGNSHSNLWRDCSSATNIDYLNLNLTPLLATGVVATDSDYSASDYEFTGIGSATLVSSTLSGSSVINVVSFTASSNCEIKGLKFKHSFRSYTFSTTSNFDALSYGYFFDEPIAVSSGETKTITVTVDLTANR